MIKAYKSKFITSKYNLDRLFEQNRLSAKVWDFCISEAKNYYKSTGK